MKMKNFKLIISTKMQFQPWVKMINKFLWSLCFLIYLEEALASIMADSFQLSKKLSSFSSKKDYSKYFLLLRHFLWASICLPKLSSLLAWKSLTEIILGTYQVENTSKCLVEQAEEALMTEVSQFWWLIKSLNLKMLKLFWKVNLILYILASILGIICYWIWWESKIYTQKTLCYIVSTNFNKRDCVLNWKMCLKKNLPNINLYVLKMKI